MTNNNKDADAENNQHENDRYENDRREDGQHANDQRMVNDGRNPPLVHSFDPHPTDQELLLAADGEIPARREGVVHDHLAACWNCRARMAEIEETIAEFARTHRQTLDSQIPPIEGPRALLRAELSQLAAQPRVSSWRSFFGFASSVRALRLLGAACLIALLGAALLVWRSPRGRAYSVEQSAERLFDRGTEPNRQLTPGATRTVAIGDVCARAHEDVVGQVSTSLREEVLQEYGIANARPDEYEIDYLIAPGLGGAEDIRNLWPEPYASRTWNAHVKDALEERLHEMVCSGALDLSTAQNDIATDWISAYKKYFKTDRPLSVRSSSERSSSDSKPKYGPRT